MKQTFLPIVVLLFVTLALVALLYFSDANGSCCGENAPAKRVRTRLIYSSLKMIDITAPTNYTAAWSTI